MANAIAKLVAELDLNADKFQSGVKSAIGSTKALAIGMTAALVAGGLVAGKVLFDIGDAADSMKDNIAIATGASGKSLDALDKSALNVFKGVPTSMEIAGTAIAALNTKTGDTGKILEGLSKSEIELARITKTDLNSNINESAKIFNAFGVAGKNQTKTLDGIFNASQKTGTGVDVLMQQLEQFSPVLKAMGLSAGQGANLLGKMDQAGLHASTDFRGLNGYVGKLAKSGTDVKTGMTDAYNAIKNAGSASAATAIAVKDFGSKAGPELAQAIRDGTISVDDLTGAVDKNGKSILDTAKGTYDFAENFTLFKNNIEAALIPLGTLVFQGLNLLIPLLTDGAKWLGSFGSAMGDAFGSSAKVSDLIKQFPDWLQPAAKALLLVADAAGDVARGFSTGGLAGAFDALGPAIKQALGALGSFAIDVVIDIGKWVIGKLPSLGDWLDTLFGGTGALPAGDGTGGPEADGVRHVTVGTLAVDILGFAAGKVADLWGWIKGLFGVGGVAATGDGTGGPDTDKVITLSSVAVGIAGWVISKAVDIGTDIATFLAATAVTLANVAVSIGSWLLNEVTDITPTLQAWLNDHTSDVVVKANATVTFVSVNLPNLGSTLLSSLWDLDTKGWGDAIGTKLATLDWGSAARGMWTALKAGLDSNVGIALVAFGGLPLIFVTAIQGGATLMAVKAAEFVAGFVQGLDDGLGTNIIPWLQALPGRAKDAIGDTSQSLYDAGTALITGLYTMANDTWTYTLSPWLASIPQMAIDGVGDLTQTLYDAGSDLVTGAWLGADAAWDNFAVWLGGRADSAIAFVGDLGSTLVSAGSSLIEGLWEGAGDVYDSFTNWLAGISDSIVSWVGNLGGILYQAGSDAVEGLIQGAMDRIPGLQTAVDILKGIWGQIPALGHSPWPMMIDAAHDAMDGLIIGTKHRMPALNDTIGGVIDLYSVSPNMSGTASFASATGGIGSSNSGASTSNSFGGITINVYPTGDPKANADEVFAAFARELGLRSA